MEIRRSVMARPNLSWRSKFLALSFRRLVPTTLTAIELKAKSQEQKADFRKRKQTGGTIPAAVSFPMRSYERGRRRRFHRHPRDNFLCELCEILCDLCGQKLLIAESAKEHKENRSLAATARYT